MKAVATINVWSIQDAATPELWQAIEGVATRLSLNEGETLFNQGDKGDSIYVIERGEIEISVLSPSGRKLALDAMRDGEVFGEIALFNGDRTATATAQTDCVLRRARRADVLRAFREHPDLAFEFIDLLCDRLRWISAQLGERSFLPVPVRLANRLVYLADKFGGSDGAVSVSQSDLADFVGSTREAVARTLATWRKRNLVKLARGSIRILDREALESLADEYDE